MNQAALIVIDMQEFFFVENAEVDRDGLARACHDIIAIGRAAGLPVIHVTTVYRADGLDWPKAWRHDAHSWCSNLVRGRDTAKVVAGATGAAADFYVEKRRFSAFYNTNLDDLLRALGSPRLYVIGYSADVCVRFTSVDAYNRGYDVSLIYEGLESFKETKDASIDYLRWTIDAESLSLDAFRSRFAAAGGPARAAGRRPAPDPAAAGKATAGVRTSRAGSPRPWAGTGAP